jgi:aldehyde:ferredoxin oxidoreductase
MYGYMGKMLEVDLAGGTCEGKPLDAELARLYVGGKAMGARLLYDSVPAGTDALGPDNVLVFLTGPLNGTGAPQSNRFVVCGKSPLTGGVGTSTCGGNFATKLRRAGYDVVIVRGRSSKPVYVEIKDGKAEIKDASHLWGMGTQQTQAEIGKRFGVACIGPAGENRILISGIVSQERMAARTGLGAVMGSKNLKALAADGSQKVEHGDPDAFKETVRATADYKKKHPMTGAILPRLGTANLVMTTSGHNILPTRNYQTGSDPEAWKLSGEEMAARHLVKKGGCISCPVKCGRVVERKGERLKGPEFETIALMGASTGNFDLKAVIEWNYLLDDLGMDSISAGNVLGFAMELTQKGLLKSDLEFGKAKNISKILEDMAHNRGLGAELAMGAKRLSEKYGGKEFAMHVKGLELPGYDPRGCWGQGLEYATTNRGGCHIQGGTMFLEATGPLKLNPHSAAAKPELVVLQQNTCAAVGSLVMCYFSAYAMIPPQIFGMDPQGLAYKLLTKALLKSGPVLGLMLKMHPGMKMLWFEKLLSAATGVSYSFGDFNTLGARCFNMERMFNVREGFTSADDRLPERVLNESTFRDIDATVPLDRMLPRYYEIRGWDAQGRPRPDTLQRLEIRT